MRGRKRRYVNQMCSFLARMFVIGWLYASPLFAYRLGRRARSNHLKTTSTTGTTSRATTYVPVVAAAEVTTGKRSRRQPSPWQS